MPGTDTPSSGGIDVSTAASQIEALLDAEENGDSDGDEGGAPENEAGADTEDDADETAADDSDEDSEVDAEDDADDESDDEPESKKPDEEFEIDLGRGNKVKVTKDELVKGYLRQSDYTRKTQELAERRRALDGATTEVLRERAQYETLLNALEEQISLSEAPSEPDWDALYAQDPIQASRLERQWRVQTEARKEKLAAIKAEKSRLEQAKSAYEQQEFRQFVEGQREVLLNEIIPQWRDPKVERREKAELVEYALNAGLTQDEVRTLADARAVAMLYKAMRYDKAMAKRAQASESAKPTSTPTLKPGSAPTKPGVKVEVKKQFDRLKKTGSIDDAAKLFERML